MGRDVRETAPPARQPHAGAGQRPPSLPNREAGMRGRAVASARSCTDWVLPIRTTEVRGAQALFRIIGGVAGGRRGAA